MFLKLSREMIVAALKGQTPADASVGDLREFETQILHPFRKAAFGDVLLEVLGRLEALYLLNLPEAPGLFMAAGQLRIQNRHGEWILFNTTGVSEDATQAMASMLGETAEVCAEQTLDSGHDEVWDAPTLARFWPLDWQDRFERLSLEWPGRVNCRSAASLTGGPDIGVPSFLCFSGSPSNGQVPFRSQGFGAGLTEAQAHLHGLWELIERDAVQAWWCEGCLPARALFDGEPGERLAHWITDMRQGHKRRLHRFLSLQSSSGLPVIAAVSSDPEGTHYACGVAARQTAFAAARSAFREMCQMEFGNSLVKGKLDKLGSAALTAEEHAQLEQLADVNLHNFAPFNPQEEITFLKAEHSNLDARQLAGALAQRGIETAAVNLVERADHLRVVKCIAPKLRPSIAHVSDVKGSLIVEKTTRGRHYSGRWPLL